MKHQLISLKSCRYLPSFGSVDDESFDARIFFVLGEATDGHAVAAVASDGANEDVV